MPLASRFALPRTAWRLGTVDSTLRTWASKTAATRLFMGAQPSRISGAAQPLQKPQLQRRTFGDQRRRRAGAYVERTQREAAAQRRPAQDLDVPFARRVPAGLEVSERHGDALADRLDEGLLRGPGLEEARAALPRRQL